MKSNKRRRILAFIIDAFSIVIISWVIGILLELLNVQYATTFAVDFAVFFMLCKDCFNGMSIGKRIFKIQVIDLNTLKAASPLKCIFRNLFYCLWIIEIPYFLFKSNGTRIGDYLVKTQVISYKKKYSDLSNCFSNFLFNMYPYILYHE